MRIFVANNAAVLRALSPAYTIEAEFGDDIVEGSEITLGHHGPRYKNICPCLVTQNPYRGPGDEIIGISHFDLDTLGGVMTCLGIKPYHESFWAAAAHVDLKGAHRLFELPWAPVDLLNAYWAWSSKPENRLSAPRDGSAKDCTEFFEKAFRMMYVLLYPDKEPTDMLLEGREWFEKNRELEELSYVTTVGDTVLLRKSGSFVNNLYRYDGKLYPAVVGYNTNTNAITISFESSIPDVSAVEIVQSLWGTSAGGHTNIAGSPRGKEMSLDDAYHTAKYILTVLDRANQ